MTWSSFRGSLVFGALAGALFPAWAVLARPLLGPASTLSLYLLAAAAIYVVGLAPRPARGLAAGALAVLLGALVLALAGSSAQVALGAALVLGCCRSVLLFRARRARAWLVEAALLGAGLAFAKLLLGPGVLGIALAIWGFFLVQSIFFLLGGVGERRAVVEGVDPFELAHERALALFEED